MMLPELKVCAPRGIRASSGLAALAASSTTEWLTSPLLCHFTVWPATITMLLGLYMGISSFIWIILTAASGDSTLEAGGATDASRDRAWVSCSECGDGGGFASVITASAWAGVDGRTRISPTMSSSSCDMQK